MMIKVFLLYGELAMLDSYVGKLVFYDNRHRNPNFKSYQYLHSSVNGIAKPFLGSGNTAEHPDGQVD